jgi:hypothetical protein
MAMVEEEEEEALRAVSISSSSWSSFISSNTMESRRECSCSSLELYRWEVGRMGGGREGERQRDGGRDYLYLKYLVTLLLIYI